MTSWRGRLQSHAVPPLIAGWRERLLGDLALYRGIRLPLIAVVTAVVTHCARASHAQYTCVFHIID